MGSLAGILLTLLAVTLIVRLASGGWNGPSGVKAWLHAKFIGGS